jgi:hypothetical protein
MAGPKKRKPDTVLAKPAKISKKEMEAHHAAVEGMFDLQAECDDDQEGSEGGDEEDDGEDLRDFVSKDSKDTPADKARTKYRRQEADEVLEEAA